MQKRIKFKRAYYIWGWSEYAKSTTSVVCFTGVRRFFKIPKDQKEFEFVFSTTPIKESYLMKRHERRNYILLSGWGVGLAHTAHYLALDMINKGYKYVALEYEE